MRADFAGSVLPAIFTPQLNIADGNLKSANKDLHMPLAQMGTYTLY
jgi:hypothetical protein